MPLPVNTSVGENNYTKIFVLLQLFGYLSSMFHLQQIHLGDSPQRKKLALKRFFLCLRHIIPYEEEFLEKTKSENTGFI